MVVVVVVIGGLLGGGLRRNRRYSPLKLDVAGFRVKNSKCMGFPELRIVSGA